MNEDRSQVSQRQLSQEDKTRLDTLVKGETLWFKQDHNKIELFASQVPILVLGDHAKEEGKAALDAVIKKLTTDLYYSAIPLKDVSRSGGNHIHCERMAMKRYPIIIKLDGNKPGTIGENVYAVKRDKYGIRTTERTGEYDLRGCGRGTYQGWPGMREFVSAYHQNGKLDPNLFTQVGFRVLIPAENLKKN